MRPQNMPAEPADIPASAIWARLNGRQRDALIACPGRASPQSAADIGAHGRTLAALNDLWRGLRGILPPIMLVSWTMCEVSGQRHWYRTDLGDAVAMERR